MIRIFISLYWKNDESSHALATERMCFVIAAELSLKITKLNATETPRSYVITPTPSYASYVSLEIYKTSNKTR